MKFLFSLLFCFVFLFSHSQSDKIEELTKEGITLHDKGDYQGAIDKYQKVLRYDPTSDLMNYEIAFSYAQSKNYVKALEHCDIVINGKGQSFLLAVILKGNILDEFGSAKEADEFYKKSLKKYPDQYLLLLNYGIRSNKRKEFDKAEASFLKALELKPSHPGSHLSLAYLKLNRGERLKGILGLYFFLMLENNTPRAAEALDKLLVNLDIVAPEAKVDSSRISMNNPFPTSHEKLSRTDLGEVSLYLITTISADLNKTKNRWEKLYYDTDQLFNILGELQSQGNKGVEDYWWGFYIRYFFELKTAGHAEAFSYLISTPSTDPAVDAWKTANKDKMDAFTAWLKKQ
jgi:tetratricopeptide (TPR) repeat protein